MIAAILRRLWSRRPSDEVIEPCAPLTDAAIEHHWRAKAEAALRRDGYELRATKSGVQWMRKKVDS